MVDAANHKPRRLTAATSRPLKEVLLVLLIGWAAMGDQLFDIKARWAVSMSGQALGLAVCLWMVRGRRSSIVWPVCMWGILEEAQTAVCQFLSVWWPVSDPRGACVHYTGIDLGPVELLVYSFIAWGLVLYVNGRGAT